MGKLKDYQAKLHINPEVKPIAQKIRRVPYGLRDKVDKKLDELISMDIIEEVTGPTTWVSPMVIVPKPSGDIRLRLDMRQANEAIIRERYQIQTVDEVLQNMNNSSVSSKLDLNMGIHQIELAWWGISTYDDIH